MSNPSSNDNAVNRLASQSDAIGRLAQNSGGFAAVVAAFESQDANAFRWVLDRLEMLPYCELICEWVRIKLCVLRCVEICGAPREHAKAITVQQFARAVAQLASNEKVLRRVVDAISCGDGHAYRAALDELKLGDYCQLLCYWICGTTYERICEVVCGPEPVRSADAESELRAAGTFIASVIENEKAFAAIAKAAERRNCETLRSAIAEAGFGSGCHIICRLICIWRWVLVCRELCEIPPPILTGAYAIEEAQKFALAARPLAGQPRVLGDLVNAVQNHDTEAYRAIISRFGLGPYCWQVCAWVGSVTCFEFCVCVCPPPVPSPIFTSVGSFGIYSDIDGSTGRTNTGAYGFGGPDYAFFGSLQLGGFCPSTSPSFPGVQMRYRFLYSTVSTSLAAGINAVQTTISVISSAAAPPTPFDVSVCNSGESGETMRVTNVAATTWTVVRGQEGTTAVAASAGATLWINPAPITGPLVSTVAPKVPVCFRQVPWTKDNLGIAGPGPATLANAQAQPVIILPTPPPPLPPDPVAPVAPAAWTGPTAHYIAPDADGWIPVDTASLFGGFTPLLVFDTTQVGAVPGGEPVAAGNFGTGSSAAGCVPAGSAVPATLQRAGTDMTIIFQATRVGVATVDYTNSLCKIRVNNWLEVNELDFAEFVTGCCTPIDKTLSVQFTVDHEEMDAGTWSLAITSCSKSAPGTITPPNPTAGVIFTAGGRGASGTIVKDTSAWCNCSYLAKLTTQPALTTGLLDREAFENPLTFAICNHKC
jgi:hypothetical protein